MGIDLSLNQLRAFHFAANCGSISRAAEQLFITQPGVSAQIKALEIRYNTQLFVRGKKKARIDRVRQAAAQDHGKNIWASGRSGRSTAVDPESALPAVLKIGSSKTLVRYLLARYIQRFRESFPRIQIQVNEGSSAEMVQGVLNNRNDLAIVGRVHYEPSLKIIPFIEDELVFLAAPGHRLCRKGTLSVEKLKGENLILREIGSGTRRIVEELLEARGLYRRYLSRPAMWTS